MIRWHSTGPHLDGFTYVPLWEAVFGAFLMLVAVALPLLFLRYNGIQAKQYPEWLFLIAFLLFFFWMGHTLAFQWFEARLTEGKIRIYHNLRGPDLSLLRPLAEWNDLKLGQAKGQDGREFTTLLFVASDGPVEIYRSIDAAEVQTIRESLEALRRNLP